MRPLTATLYVNDGTPALNSSQSVEARLVTLGRLEWSVDDQLTKLSPSDLTLQVADDDEVVWTWLQTQIQTLQSGTQQLFPPWIAVYLGGSNVFTGLVDLTSLKRDYSKRIIDFSAQDWSAMLANIPLDSISRPLPRTARLRPALPSTIGNSHTYVPLGGNQVFFGIGVDIQVGDYLTCEYTGVQQFKVTEKGTGTLGQPLVTLDGFDWRNIYGWDHTNGVVTAYFSRVVSDLDFLPCYTVLTGVLPGNSLGLDSTDGLTPGDTLTAGGGAEVLIGDIDNERNEISSVRSIVGINVGTSLFLNSESMKYLVNKDALKLAQLVALPYTVDAARYVPGDLARPLFGWLTNWNATGRDLLHPSDIEPTADGRMRVICTEGAFTGTPESGYSPDGLWGIRYVDWSSQQVAPPAYVMPDEGPAISSDAGTRNRVYYTWSWVRETYIQTHHGDQDLATRWVWEKKANLVYTPRLINYPTYCIGYDYSQLRRIVISNPNSGYATFSEQRWTGSVWTTATTGNWPVSGFYPCQMVPMPGVAATNGPVDPQGLAMLALVSDGTRYFLHLVWAGSLVSIPVDISIASGAQLVTTPWGAYLVGPGGYARIIYDGTLRYGWISTGDPKSAVLIANTFAALDANSVYCFLRIDYPDPDNQSSVLTETRMLNLTTNPQTGVDPVLFSLRVMPGAPRIARAFRDPSVSGRIIGLLGSRLFRISSDPVSTIERMAVSAMTGQEALEHVGQFLNAIVIPMALGRVELVSRDQAGAATNVTVDQVSITQSRMSPNFFSVVRVSSEDDNLYSDVSGLVTGGKSLEISSSPTVWTEAGCYGMAMALADFFGVPRRVEEQTWCWEDTNSAPPWEVLDPWSPITVNGGATVWMFAGMSYDLIKGEAKVTLVERV